MCKTHLFLSVVNVKVQVGFFKKILEGAFFPQIFASFSVQKYEHLMPSKELITGLECRIDILEVPGDRLGLGGKYEIAANFARILARGWWLTK